MYISTFTEIYIDKQIFQEFIVKNCLKIQQ